MTAVGQLWSRVADRVRGAARRGNAPAIAALDIGTEYAKALVLSVERDGEGRLTGIVRGSGRQRQGLAHMQSGTVSDIDAVVANSRVAMEAARAESGRARSIAQIDAEEVARRVAGLAAGEAEAALQDLGDATVDLWPEWVESIPSMEWRIDVRVNEP